MKLYIPLLSLLLLTKDVSTLRSKHVSMNLKAKWHTTPLVLEASEFVAEEGNDKFWSFVDAISERDPEVYVNAHEKAQYELAKELSASYLSSVKLGLLDLSLAQRSYSARVRMFNQMGHDKRTTEVDNCEAFVDIQGVLSCDQNKLLSHLENAHPNGNTTHMLKSDHVFPGSAQAQLHVVLYGELGTASLSVWHKALRPLALEGRIAYILRHYIQQSTGERVTLSGYGVELAIKSQEYKAKDDTKVQGDGQTESEEDWPEDEDVSGFSFHTLRKLHADLKEGLGEMRQNLLASTNEIPELKAWQLQDLSFQAAQRVLQSPEEEQLAMLRDVSQNFPVQTRHLVKTSVTEELRKEIQKNQQVWESDMGVYPGDSALFVNGLQADLDTYDVYSLLDTLRSEAALMQGVHDMGLMGEEARSLLRLDLKDDETRYALDIRNEAVVWINDLSIDRKYQGWTKSVTEMLRPTFPGMLRYIRANLFNILFIVDPANLKTTDLLKMVEAFYVHSAPFRVGVVLVPQSSDSDDISVGWALTRAFHYLSAQLRPMKALEYVTEVYEAAEGEITLDDVVELIGMEGRPSLSLSALMGDQGKQYDATIEIACEFLESSGLGTAPQVLVNGVPLSGSELNADGIEEAVLSLVMQLTPSIQKAVYHGQLNDNMDVLDFLMGESHVLPRLNSRILSPSEQHLDLTSTSPAEVMEQPEVLERLAPAQLSAAMLSHLTYLAKKEEEAVRSISHWVVADVDTVEGRELIYHAIKHLKNSNNGRVAVIHNPSQPNAKQEDGTFHFAKAVQVALESLPSGQAKQFITKLVKEEFATQLLDGSITIEDLAVSGMDVAAYKSGLESKSTRFLQGHSTFCRRILQLQPGQRAVICNGKVLGPLHSGERFTTEDFNLLEQFTARASSEKILKLVNKMKRPFDEASDMVLRLSSLLMSSPRQETRRDVTYHTSRHSVLNIAPRDPAKPAYHVVAILDPASRAAQKYTPIIMALREVVNVHVQIFFNCRGKLSEAPIKSFYRFVLAGRPEFGAGGLADTDRLRARFDGLPSKPVLTLGVDAPESWLVEAVRAQHDLDNIQLQDISGSVEAEFELEYLLLEGHCFDANTGQPPRGLEFTLGTERRPAQVDTIVMANLGYFQLKANPGAWELRLRGRSTELYDITSHEQTDSPSDSPDIVVVMDTFKSKIIKVRVSKKKGLEKEDLLSDTTDPEQGIWDSISRSIDKWPLLKDLKSKLTGGTRTQTDENGHDVINIFSLASGHLYERFIRIMILSVLKQTQSKVKFWFLKNYLSPSFKDFIPHMAQEYGFEYELVQYKWPRWLHQQSEKQRIMWGYKILFLDVLFPLNVSKIIFVDADQIVRTDLKELVDFDLEGAPYGYTPFCESRKEMDGFRFWKSGYWAGHLAGRKYHISALYVVDLKKFRKIAAGDRLRGQYQGLSQDPNSLSNLDQDLPNNMIHQVPIKSLPQDWLWCETWCSNEDKPRAKTIDLCNNPLTKEPKLTAAVRIVPEWTSYDEEVRSLWNRVYGSPKGTDEGAAIDGGEGTTDNGEDKKQPGGHQHVDL